MNRDNIILLHLSLIQGIGPGTVAKIIKKFLQQSLVDKNQLALNLEKIYNYSADIFIEKFGITNQYAKLLYYGLKDKNLLNKELELIKRYNIDIVTLIDNSYPENLKQIHMPPIVLYCKGEKLNNFTKLFSVVGARKATHYAKDVVCDIIPDLVANGFCIVSGGALGVDAFAHQESLNCQGKTIVVLGSGLLESYPSENKKLFKDVVKNGGTVISPFPLKSLPHRGNFPARNRIIAGLSLGCLIVQAAKKSGALITAKLALEEGRQVFAIPGSIYDELSVGCNQIIKQGAKLVQGIEDILEEFGEYNFSKKKIVRSNNKKNIFLNEEALVESGQDNILKNLKKPISLDELSLNVKLSLDELQEILFDLQLEGKVTQGVSGLWMLSL